MASHGPVLVVEDDVDVREAFREALEDEGYTVVLAEDGRAALELLATVTPCLVLLDLMMPGINGFQVLDEMRAQQRLSTIPVCVVTATPDRAPADVACVLGKPIKLPLLLNAVETYC